MPEEEVKETKKDKEKEEEKDGEKLALGLVGAGLLAAGTAVGISKLNEQGSDIRVKKNYADLSSDMNSIPIIDIDDSGNSGVIKMAEEQPIEVVSSDPVEDMVVEEQKEQTTPEPVQEPQPIKQPSVGSSGGSGGGGGYTPSGTGGGNSGGEVTPTSEVVPQEAEPAYDLVISVSEVENFISKLKTAAKGLEDNWKDIFDTELNKLKESWAGPDMEDYIERVQALDPKIEKAVEAIKLLMNTYKQALEKYEEQAKKIADSIKE